MTIEGLYIQLLGRFEVRTNGQAIPEGEWRSKRARSLVKLLALAPGQRLTRDQVLDTLWPDSDFSAATNNLHQTLYTARKIFDMAGMPALALVDGLLKLGESVRVDVEQFESAAALAHGSQDVTLFQIALDHYAGELLPEDLYEEWTVARRESLRLLHLNLLLELARLREARKEYAEGIQVLGRLLELDRAHEEAHTLRMRLYALTGQRAQALRQFQVLTEALHSELEIKPGPAAQRLFEQIQSGRLLADLPPEPALTPSAGPTHNLPAELTSFIGREREIEQVGAQIQVQRLVTLTGTGGTGKTRLALKVAAAILPAFPDGVWLVELASLSDPELVSQACLLALEQVQPPGLSREAALAGFLKNRQALLILDNCEHLLAACAHLVNVLLKGCPRLHILTTSREILSLPGENPFRVPSLSLPDLRDLPSVQEQAQFEAPRLLIERAAQTQPGFALTVENAPLVAQICARLDGIPLAIELAAARLRVLSLQQLAARLDQAFRILTGGSKAVLPRQQTLRAAIDWSYNLLSPPDRQLLQRLSVFSGGWTLEAAEAVCPDGEGQPGCGGAPLTPEDMIDLLAQLVDKSLVIATHRPEGVRYHLLETIRQYARDRLAESGCGEAVRDRHLVYFARLSGEAEPHLRSWGQVEWGARLDRELENLLVAQEWALSGRFELGLKIAADLMWFWHSRTLHDEVDGRILNLLAAEEQARGGQPPSGPLALQRARAQRTLATIAGYATHEISLQDMTAYARESVAILRTLSPQPRRELGMALLSLLVLDEAVCQDQGLHAELLGIFEAEKAHFEISEYYFFMVSQAPDLKTAINYEEKSLALARAHGDWDGILSRSSALARMVAIEGRYAEARQLLEESEEASHRLKHISYDAAYSLAYIALHEGNLEEALRQAKESLSEHYRSNYLVFLFLPLSMLQQVSWASGDFIISQQYARQMQEMFGDQHIAVLVSNLYLARAALSLEDLPRAKTILVEASASPFWGWVKTAQNFSVTNLLTWIHLFSRLGRSLDAARLMGAVSARYAEYRGGLNPRERSEFDQDQNVVHQALGDADFQAAFAAGEALSIDQAAEWALANL